MSTDRTAADAANYLQGVCHEAAHAAGWWDTKLTPQGFSYTVDVDLRAVVRARTRFGIALVNEKIALIHSEVSEALEGARKDKQDEHLPHRKSVEVELADAVIRICDLAGAMGLDLGGALAEKMAYNAQREDHKVEARTAVGGKAF